jgi:hypothetical protein
MADPEALLRRHCPILLYDSQEAYFADHPAQMVVNPGNELRRGADGTLIARVDDGSLTLDTLRAKTYPDGTTPSKDDVLSIKGTNYAAQYAALRENHQELKNHIVARAVRDRQQVLWLQYWLWYFYNDYRLAASYGLHEGDWELVQIRLGGDGDTPDLAVYAQHAQAEQRSWDRVSVEGDRPRVYVARGSHASYFRAGVFQTEVWADVCDGGRRSPEPTLLIIGEHPHDWAGWPGRWGDTKPGARVDKSLGSPSPDGPCRKPHWLDPRLLADKAREELDPDDPLPGPQILVGRRAGRLLLKYDLKRVTGRVVALVVTVNSADEPTTPPKTFKITVTGTRGSPPTEIPVVPDHTYQVLVSMELVQADGTILPTASIRRTLDTGDHAPRRRGPTQLGVVAVRIGEWLKRLLGRGPRP